MKQINASACRRAMVLGLSISMLFAGAALDLGCSSASSPGEGDGAAADGPAESARPPDALSPDGPVADRGSTVDAGGVDATAVKDSGGDASAVEDSAGDATAVKDSAGDATAGDATVGDAALSCDELVALFEQAFDRAVECSVGCGCCTAQVIGMIYPGCPCPIIVNAQQTQAIAEMQALRAQFAAMACPGPTCKCKTPTSATCTQTPGSTTGICLNTF